MRQETKKAVVSQNDSVSTEHPRAAYHSPNQVDDTRYEIDPYTEITVAVPHQDGYFDSPEMAYASEFHRQSASVFPHYCPLYLGLADRADAAGVSPTSPYGNKSAQSRNSFASSPGYMPGLTPYQPHSPGMSEGSSSHQPASAHDQASSQSSGNRHSKSPRQLPVPGNQVRQETDAGRVALVPPSYDPTWAQDGPVADVTVGREEVSPVPSAPVHHEAGNMKG